MTFKIVIRNLLRRPFLNLIKIVGLSLAFSCILLIMLFLKNELSYDRFHQRSDRIYRFTTTSPTFFSGKHFARIVHPTYIPAMAETFPEIENYVRLVPVSGGVIRFNQEYFNISEAFECDSTFFQVFDAEMVVGDPVNILDNRGSLVLCESFKEKVFGDEDPIGQIITLPAGQYYAEDTDFIIRGIMKDFPQNSHFHPEFITTPVDETAFGGWAFTYLLLKEHSNPEHIISNFKSFSETYRGMNPEEFTTRAHLQQISDIHLHSKKTREIEPNSNMSVIYSFSLAAILLLTIALLNYANLNLGMEGYIEKYLFVVKVLGSSGIMKLRYFLAEGILVALSTLLLGGIIATLVLTGIEKKLALDLFRNDTLFVTIIAFMFCLLIILAAAFPLFRNQKRRRISRGVIVFQYALSIGLIISVVVIQRQTSYALNSGMGVKNKNLICLENVHTNVQAKFTEFKEELLKYNSIQYISAMFEPPGGEANDMFRFEMEGYEAEDTESGRDMIGVFPCDYSFASIFNLHFMAGDNFSHRNFDREGSGEYIINETAMRRLNYTDPSEIIGKGFRLVTNFEGITIPDGKITGVVEDFHHSSLKREIEPLVMFKREDLWISNFVIAFRPGLQTEALSDLKKVWNEMFSAYPLEFEYVDTMYRDVYSSELLQARLLSIFTAIALFICSMGLLGMSLLTTQKRIKEIGTRKVHGASIFNILSLLFWDILKWILFSVALAIPVSYLAMTLWLENFTYKTGLTWWIFILSGIFALVVAGLTVSVQTWKASRTNPVVALRYE